MSADLLARLIAAGTDPALVAEVALIIARADAAGEQLEGRRSKDRERQSRRRHAMSRDITLDSVTSRDVTGEPSPAPSPLPPPCTPHQPHAPTPTREGNPARTRKGGTWPCPDDIEPQHWADLQANRRAKRMALTPTALEHQLRQIEKFTSDEWPPGRIVQHAAAKGWAAIHDPREPHENRNGKRPHNDDRPRSRGLLGAVLDAEHDSRAGFGF